MINSNAFSAWYYPGLVLFFSLVVGVPFGMLFGTNVLFDFINLGIVLAILTYVGQHYVMPYVLSELRKDRTETARLERQEDSFASQAESLAHDAARLMHYNEGLKQKMLAWVTAKRLQMVNQRMEQERVQTYLEQRSQDQMRNRYSRELSYQSLCNALSKARDTLSKKYAHESNSQTYMQSLMQQLQDKQ